MIFITCYFEQVRYQPLDAISFVTAFTNNPDYELMNKQDPALSATLQPWASEKELGYRTNCHAITIGI